MCSFHEENNGKTGTYLMQRKVKLEVEHVRQGFPCVNRAVNLRNRAVQVRKGTVLHQDLLEIGNFLKVDAVGYIRRKKAKRLMIAMYFCPDR